MQKNDPAATIRSSSANKSNNNNNNNNFKQQSDCKFNSTYRS
jgi:hypothetical protein